MTLLTQSLNKKDRYNLFLSLRDYYEKIGQFLPNKTIDRIPVDNTPIPKKMPNGISFNEIKLWQVDQEDHDFRSQFLGDLPDFLSGYFANRYIKLFKTKNRAAANTFLRKTLGGNIKNRLELVKQRYKSETPSHLAIHFASELEKLPTFDHDRICDVSYKFSQYFDRFIEMILEQNDFKLSANDNDKNSLEFHLYREILTEVKGIDIDPPYYADYKNDKLTTDNIIKALAKITTKEWWFSKLKRRRDFQAEHLAIAVGQVQAKASTYASRTCISEFLAQKKRNQKYLEKMMIENEDTGEQIPLDLQVYKSISNPAIRRAELMNRMRGFENIADEFGYSGAFITITAPSKYHSAHSKGGFVDNWQGNTPRDTQAYLCGVWSRIRAKLNRNGIKVFGFRVAEPHHDGTPHWHILVFMRPEDVQTAFRIMWIYSMDEDVQEKGAALNRFKFEMIDKEKGSATGYIAKYISKNIDGYALDGEIDDESGKPLKDVAKAVTAWASRWKIRQFQQIGGAPVSVWRELRRLKEKRTGNKIIDDVLTPADDGDWAEYITKQGGPMVSRKDLAVRLSYEEKMNQYEEPVKKINGVFSPILGISSYLCTRLIKWKIILKSQVDKLSALKNRANSPPWSSVNNCTHDFTDEIDDQREKIRQQLKIIGIPDDDVSITRLFLREKLKINQNQYLKLDNVLNGVHLIVCNGAI